MTDTLNPLLVRRQMQVPVLRPLFRRGEDLSVHRAPSVLGHHHRLREQRQLPLRIPVHPVSHAFARTLAPRDPDVLASISLRGALSTVFLYLVDVQKSRKECEEFIVAEAKREAFADTVP